MNKISLSSVFLFFCFVFLVISNQYIPARLGYVVLGVLAVLAAIKGASFNVSTITNNSEGVVAFLAFSVLLSWTYGLFLGGFYNVSEGYLFVNFAGMFFYILVFGWLVIRPKMSSIFRVFIYAFIIQLLFGVVAFFGKLGVISGARLDGIQGVSDLRSVYSVGFAIGFPILTVSLYSLLNSKAVPSMWIVGKKSAILVFIASLFLVVVPAMSKGFILAVVVFLTVIFFASNCGALARMRVSLLMVSSSLILAVFASYFLYSFFDVIVYSFSGEEVSNAKRSEQAKYILDEISLWGAGLGAGLDSGYTRAAEPYAFELSYLSVVHKLGIFSLSLFFAYFYSFYKSFIGLFSETKGISSAFCLGLMGYAIVGIGNPILLGGLGVFFHSLSMFLLASNGSRKDSVLS